MIKLDKIVISANSGIDELAIQKLIADDPVVLGLGDLKMIDRERNQIGAAALPAF